MADKIIEGVRARDFVEWLTDLDHGSVNQQLSEKLLELGSAVEDTGKSGKLQITITLKKEGDMATVKADIKVTKPEHPQHSTLFYFGASGSLHREDPRQLKLRKIADVPALKSVNHPEQE